MTNNCDGYNLIISPKFQAQSANSSKVNFALGPFTRKQLHTPMLVELQEVLQFFYLNLSCQHTCCELYLSTSLLNSLPATRICSTCPIPNQPWHTKGFLLVLWCSVNSFIEWLAATAKLLPLGLTTNDNNYHNSWQANIGRRPFLIKQLLVRLDPAMTHCSLR